MSAPARRTLTPHTRLLARLLSAALLALAVHAAGARSVELSPDAPSVSLVDALELYVDPTNRLTIDDVARADFAARFARPSRDPRNLGHVHDTVWVRFTLRAAAGDAAPRLLELAYTFADEAVLYSPRTGGGFAVSRAGDHTRVSEREHPDRLYLFSVAPTPGADTTYFLRYRNVGLLSLPLEVWRADALRAERSRESLLLGIYYGCLLALIVYNLMLYIATRLRAYLAYVGYGAVMLFFMATQNGYTSFYLWPEWPALADPAAYVSPLAALGGACVFVREYLATATLTPAIDRALRALTAATFVLLAVNPLLPRPAAFWSMLFWGGTGAALVYALALYFALALRSRPGTFLSIALTLPVLGAALAVARNVGWLAVGWVTEHGMQIGMMVEMLVLSLGLAEQVAVIHREREEARRAAAEDTLTGLASRARLAAQLPAALSRARRGTHKLALLWLDLDNFKPINDRYGHAVGDAVLKEAAARMRETVRTHDFVARLGGDEFVILADVYDGTAEASALAARLINAIERPMRQGHLDLSVTASIGIAVFPQHAESESDLMQRADLAMYQAKAEGRNTFKLAA